MWTDLVNVTVTGDVLQKTGGCDRCEDAGAASQQAIAQGDGFVEFTVGEIDTFSEEAGNYEILLSNASQVQLDGSLLPVVGEGVLLTKENPIIRVELWDPGVGVSVASRGEPNV